MSADPDSTWATLEALAVRLLEHPKDLEPRDPIRRYGSLWRLWHFPPFAAQTTWTILTPGRKSPDGSPPLVREVSWDRARDNERISAGSADARPSIRLRDAHLQEAELRRLIEEGARLAVPLVVFAKVVGVRTAGARRFSRCSRRSVTVDRLCRRWCDILALLPVRDVINEPPGAPPLRPGGTEQVRTGRTMNRDRRAVDRRA